MNNVITFVACLIEELKWRAPASTTTQFLIGVIGQFALRGLVKASQWTRRPSREEVRDQATLLDLAAWAFRELGAEWLEDSLADILAYQRKAKPLQMNGEVPPMKAGIFGDLEAKAKAKQAKLEEGRVRDLDARAENLAASIIAEVQRAGREAAGELDGDLSARQAEWLLTSLFGAAEGCAVNAVMRSHHRMPAIAASGLVESQALEKIGTLLNAEVARLLAGGDDLGAFVPEREMTSAEALRDLDVDCRDEELESVRREVMARTRQYLV